MGDYRGEVTARAREVDGHLSSRNYGQAVIAAVRNPPIACPDQGVKDQNFDTVMRALSAPAEKQIGQVVNEVVGNTSGEDLADNLMKYIYRGLSVEQSNGPLFTWYRELVNAAGMGCVVRALTDRKSV